MAKLIQSSSGNLVQIDLKDIPFIPKRVFYVFDVAVDGVRGKHAHKKDKQFLICSSGKIALRLTSRGETLEVFLEASCAAYIPPLTWVELTYLEANTTIICFCSEEYDENDYIRDFKEFLRRGHEV